MIITDRRYCYKGKEYNAISFSKTKNPITGEWFDTINYQRTFDKSITFVREAEEFKSRFIPTELEVGDLVKVTSMGKIVGVIEVENKTSEGCKLEGDLPCCLAILPNVINPNGEIAELGNYKYSYYYPKK